MKTLNSLLVKLYFSTKNFLNNLVTFEKPESEMSVDEFIANHHLKNFPNQKSCALPSIKVEVKQNDDLEDSSCLVLA